MIQHYHQHGSTIINMHQQDRMYTSTACWKRLSTRQGTAWPLHPTRRQGLRWQRALLNSSHKDTNLGKILSEVLPLLLRSSWKGCVCVWKHWHVDRTWQHVAESEHDNIFSKLSKLNEGPLLRRLLETLGMVEIPQVTLPSPPQEENERNQSQQRKPIPLYVTDTETKHLKYHRLNHILWVTLTFVYINHVKSTSSKDLQN